VSEATLLALTAVAFALVTGANDGATLVAINLPNPAIRPPAAVAILAVAVAGVPLVAGSACRRSAGSTTPRCCTDRWAT